MQRTPEEKRKLLARLRRAEGQVAAIARMVEEDAYCVDVLIQISAARGALDRAGQDILRHHVQTCVTRAMRSDDLAERDKKIDELMDVFGRYGGGRRA